MASNLMASDLLDIDWGRRARDILANARLQEALRNQPKRVPEIRVPVRSEPVEIREKNVFTNPDSWLNRGLENLLDVGYTSVFGEGTGNMAADLAFGLTGPGSAAATIAAGNRPGVLDFLPGGGALKAGVVLAAPKAIKAITRAGARIDADDAVDFTKEIAQTVVDRLAKSDVPVTREMITREIAKEVDGFGDFAGALTVKRRADDLAQDLYGRYRKSLETGVPFTLDVRTPVVMRGITGGTLKETIAPSSTKEYSLANAKKNYSKDKETFESMPDELRANIEREAKEAGEKAYSDAMANGETNKTKLAGIKNNAFQNTWRKAVKKYSKEAEKEQTEIVELPAVEVPEDIRKAGQEAFLRAREEAIRAGYDKKEVQRVSQAARRRTQNELIKANKELNELKNAKTKIVNSNLHTVIGKFSPELLEELKSLSEKPGREAYERALALGATEKKALLEKNQAIKNARYSRAREIIKELGFTSPNDLRINNYRQLGRTPEEHILKPSSILMPEAASPERAYSARLASGSMLDDIPDSEIESMLREYGETPTADAAFNREYLEELLREEGY